MSESLERFVLNNAVASKLSNLPVVGRYGERTFVFVHGYPMSVHGFYTMSTKAIFGASVHLSVRNWEVLHAETLLLSKDLALELHQGREAFSVMLGIRKALNWSKETYSAPDIVKWVEEVDRLINQEEGE